ncbi:uncharacterized protein JCM6883_006929 [Sporobolomyces salmoneus]|uniref:uncharacterized protein n=1 Tax=Sporobolomyces salmoneus TaxID=183962 RepID=UPI00317A0A66
MSLAVVSPAVSPRIGFPSHRTNAPLVSILRSTAARTPLASPRTPGGCKAARIEAAVTDYFSVGNYEGSTRTPISTPAPLGVGAPYNSPRIGFALAVAESKQQGLDLSSLDASLAALGGGQASPALSSSQSPYPMSFAFAGSALSSHPRTFSPNPSWSLSSRRRPSLRISDLPPVVLPDLHSLDQLSVPSSNMSRGDSDASATTTSSEVTLTGRRAYAGNTPGGGGLIGLGFGGGESSGAKRIPTPYPERKAWIEDEDVY